jgi:SAM-dependent methyltransferase
VSTGWEDRALQWLAWARRPGFDPYWAARETFFALVPEPMPGERALEVGCGEGRVSRDLAARGHRVTGIDASPTLLAAAAAAHPGGDYRVAAAEALPFAPASFDLVVAYNVLMDVADMPRAVAEAARVLRPGGHLCCCVTHPFADAGSWEDDAFVVRGSYLAGGEFDDVLERGGLMMRFDGRLHTLTDYFAALEAAGLAVEALREPAGEDRWARVPMFLMFRAATRDREPPQPG